MTRNIVILPQENIHGRNSLSPPRHSFFLIPTFQNLGLKVVPPPAKKGAGTDTVRVLRYRDGTSMYLATVLVEEFIFQGGTLTQVLVKMWLSYKGKEYFAVYIWITREAMDLNENTIVV